jgi:hypothetical protein
MWSAAVFDPAFPGRTTLAIVSPFPSGPWSAQAVIGWSRRSNQVGEACFFSECAITTIRSLDVDVGLNIRSPKKGQSFEGRLSVSRIGSRS